MGKLYTLDGKLLTDTPEVRVGEKVYPVDNRKKTVTRALALIQSAGDGPDAGAARVDEVAQLILGDAAYKELEALDMPWPAWNRLFELLMAAVTGEEADAPRFQHASGGKSGEK